MFDSESEKLLELCKHFDSLEQKSKEQLIELIEKYRALYHSAYKVGEPFAFFVKDRLADYLLAYLREKKNCG